MKTDIGKDHGHSNQTQTLGTNGLAKRGDGKTRVECLTLRSTLEEAGIDPDQFIEDKRH